jgi:hypothetical protein
VNGEVHGVRPRFTGALVPRKRKKKQFFTFMILIYFFRILRFHSVGFEEFCLLEYV